MRKLLLSSTALATAAALTAGAAVADVSISAATEFSYESRSSQVAASDGTTFNTDSEIHFNFTNKTDTGLTIGYKAEMFSDGTDTAIEESSMSISGGFGKIVLGEDDGVGDSFGIAEMDLIAEESNSNAVSTSINVNSDIAHISNKKQIAYFLPAMGGFTAGASFYDSGTNTGTDATSYGAQYTMDANGTAITIGAATNTTEAATKDTDSQNMGVKIVSGNISMILSSGSEEGVDEDITTQGASVSYKMDNGMTLAAYTLKSEDDLDAGEEYAASGVEVQYTIAAGLTAVLTVDDYEYTAATSQDATRTATGGDAGTTTSLTLKATF